MAKKFKFDGLLKAAEEQKAAAEKTVKPKEVSIKDQIQIRDEFKSLIPPLAHDEFKKLEENILAEGCRDALIVWKKEDDYILIDGHNRYEICTSHGLDFKVQVMEFDSSDQVSDWMVSNQLGKRNVSEETKSYLRGLQYNREKKRLGENQYTQNRVGQNVPSISTAERLANQHFVSEKTIKRDEKYALAIDKIASGNKKLKWNILNKQISLTKGDVMKLLNEEEEDIKTIGEFLLAGENLAQALKRIKKVEVTKEEPSPEQQKIKRLQNNIATAVKDAIKQNSSEPLEEARDYIKKLSKLLGD